MSLNILCEDMDIVFVALNPTKEAKMNESVFSTDRGFWNILQNARITKDTSEVNLRKIANMVFGEDKHLSNKRIGFADLIEDTFEKDSKKVKVPKGLAINLVNKLGDLRVKKIALMGQKVVDAFHKDYPYEIPSWKSKIGYGECGK